MSLDQKFLHRCRWSLEDDYFVERKRPQVPMINRSLWLLVFSWNVSLIHSLSPSPSSRRSIRRLPIGRIVALDRSKLDTQPDGQFYQRPNLITHVDDTFIDKLQNVYRENLEVENPAAGEKPFRILDLMSSHVSHLPPEWFPESYMETDIQPHDDMKLITNNLIVDVHGMNEEELRQNPARQVTGGKLFVRDLNENPSLIGLCDDDEADDLYDVVLCCVGIQYLQEPEAVLAEVSRVLKPNTGKVIISFSNKFHYPKALQGWMDRGMQERARLVQDYLRAAGGFVAPSQVVGDGTSVWNQLTSLSGLSGDPFVAVLAQRDDKENDDERHG